MRQLKEFAGNCPSRWPAWILLIAGLLACVPAGRSATLRRETRAAFEQYVRLTDSRNDQELTGHGAFLWVDTLPEAQRKEAYAKLAAGEVEIRHLETLDAGKEIPCPGGMIHHWIGAVFLPGAALDDVLGVLEDYDHHAEYFRPDVERSRIESKEGEHYRVFLRFRRTKVITVVLDTVHDVRYFRDTAFRAHSRSGAVRISEVDNAGKKDEREKTPGEDNGFLWNMETWWRMEQKDGGVYVQSEVVSLTRDIPVGLGWMVGPFVSSIPKESLEFTMQAARGAVLRRKQELTKR